jgi:uncharacterized protein YuzE
MKILYEEEKDVLSIVFKEDVGMAVVLAEFDIALSVNNERELVGIDIPSASRHVDLGSFSIDLKHDLGSSDYEL